MEKMNKKGKGGKKGGIEDDGARMPRNTNSSSQVFKNLQKIVKDDYKRKEDKKTAKELGMKAAITHSGVPSKRFKL